MKKISKRFLSIALALIMAMPIILAAPFDAAANITAYNGNQKYRIDFSGTNTFVNNNNNVGSITDNWGNTIKTFIYSSNSFSKTGIGVGTNDGYIFLDDLASRLEDNKDIRISFNIKMRNNMDDAWRGMFSIGSARSTAGDYNNTGNDLISMTTDGKVRYRGNAGSPSGEYDGIQRVVSKPTKNQTYQFDIVYLHTTHTVSVYIDNALYASRTDASISKANFNYLSFGYHQQQYYGNFEVGYIDIQQPYNSGTIPSASTSYSSHKDTHGTNVELATVLSYTNDFYTANYLFGGDNNYWVWNNGYNGRGVQLRNPSGCVYDAGGYMNMWHYSGPYQYVSDDNTAASNASLFQTGKDFKVSFDFGITNYSGDSEILAFTDSSNNRFIHITRDGKIYVNGTERAALSRGFRTYDSEYGILDVTYDNGANILYVNYNGENDANLIEKCCVAISGVDIEPGNIAYMYLGGVSPTNSYMRIRGIAFYEPVNPYNISTSKLNELKAACTAYENKMADGKVYTGAKDAYDAYLWANRYITTIEYGGSNNDCKYTNSRIDGVIANLTMKTNNMSEWSGFGAQSATDIYNNGAKWQGCDQHLSNHSSDDWEDSTHLQEVYNNLLWADKIAINGNSNDYDCYAAISERIYPYGNEYFRGQIAHSSAVMLYDGTSEPTLPVMCKFHIKKDSTGTPTARAFSAYLNNSSDLSLRNDKWRGSDTWYNFIYCYYNNTGGTNISSAYRSDSNSNNNYETFASNSVYNYANVIKFSGSFDSGVYYKKVVPTWTFQVTCNDNNQSLMSASGTEGNNYSIYVINYKAIKDTLKNNATQVTRNVANYKEGGLTSFFDAYEAAINLDPNSYGEGNWGAFTEYKVEHCAQDIKLAIDEINNTVSRAANVADTFKAEMDADADDYANRAALTDTYTYSSVSNFATNYESAQWYMSCVLTWGYNHNVGLSTFYNNLKNAHDALTLKADLSDFDTAYTTADSFLKEIAGEAARYNASDINALVTLMNSSAVQEYATQSADDRKNFAKDGDEDTEATTLAGQINSAYEAFHEPEEVESSVSFEAYNAVIDQIENIDPDAFDYSAEDRAKDINTYTKILRTTATYDGQTIYVIKDTVTQSTVDAVASFLQSRANAHIREYKIAVVEGSVSNDAGITFSGGNSRFDSTENAYYATYGTKVNFKSDSANAAWFMEFYSETASRNEQYQATGKYFSANVFGNLNVSVKAPSDGHKVTICRNYSDSDRTPISMIDYVDGTFTVPNASALPFYRFEGYTLNDEPVNAGDELTITSDTVIIAHYSVNEGLPFAINIDADGFENTTASYNEKVILEGNNDTYAWLEKKLDSSSYKPFYIGKDVSFFATESINLKPVTEAEFIAGGYSVPNINVRQNGTIIIETDGKKKVTFNGQFVTDGTKTIVEYGVLMGKATPSGSISASDVVLENNGASSEYNLTRFKSTKDVGAHQFAISVSGITGDIIYKGYITYRNAGGANVTVYTDAFYETI